MIKKCVECGAEFYAPPSSKKITCSKECMKIRRSRVLKNHSVSDETRQKLSAAAKRRENYENLKNGTAAAKRSEKGGRNEKNSSAKTYFLISPDGRKFTVTNLVNWIRNHIDMFECEETDIETAVDRISHGFYEIKYNIKKNRRGQTYKGWSIYNWDDRRNCDK